MTHHTPKGGGPDLGLASDIWTKLAESECRIKLFRELIELGVSVNEVESFASGIGMKFRSEKFQRQGVGGDNYNVQGVKKEDNRVKLRDEETYCRELKWKQQQLRKEIHESYGEHKQKTRRVIQKLRNEAAKVKNTSKRWSG